MSKIQLILLVTILVLAGVFMLENLSNKVTVEFLSFDSRPISAAVLILVSVAVGAAVGFIAGYASRGRPAGGRDRDGGVAV
jgi:hypothetical protein